jgi:DnaK suppressor protein
MELNDLRHSNPSAASGDAADAAFDTGSEEIASHLLELEGKEMRQIERALTKIKNGTYGVCEGCQTKIPVARLNALPYSTLCVKCQREMETNASWGGGRLGAGWDQVVDHESAEPNHVDLSNLEMDLSR